MKMHFWHHILDSVVSWWRVNTWVFRMTDGSCILLIQPLHRPASKTYTQFDSLTECLLAVIKIYEEHLKNVFKNVRYFADNASLDSCKLFVIILELNVRSFDAISLIIVFSLSIFRISMIGSLNRRQVRLQGCLNWLWIYIFFRRKRSRITYHNWWTLYRIYQIYSSLSSTRNWGTTNPTVDALSSLRSTLIWLTRLLTRVGNRTTSEIMSLISL